MKYAIMFNVLKDGEIEPINWGKDYFKPNNSIILLEEYTPAVWLWHGNKQSLIDRRIANRQAESLKGYGYKAGGTIIGSRTRVINEIDQRLITKDAVTDKNWEKFQEILEIETEPLDQNIVIIKEEGYEDDKVELRPTPELETSIIKEEPPIEGSSSEIPEKAKVAKEISIPKVSKYEKKDISLKTTAPSENTKTFKKAEYSFESEVKEIPSPEIELTQSQIASIKDALETSLNLHDILSRIEKIEKKIDGFIQEFQDFKKMYQSNRKNKND
ncbi:MAG: hypothetical protein EU539_11370 [Promethearchaeota archaeon]|nr:MAG: hypothetical protein EU539_11370 [Candidatus Lokiarchaeota archaeon]